MQYDEETCEQDVNTKKTGQFECVLHRQRLSLHDFSGLFFNVFYVCAHFRHKSRHEVKIYGIRQEIILIWRQL